MKRLMSLVAITFVIFDSNNVLAQDDRITNADRSVPEAAQQLIAELEDLQREAAIEPEASVSGQYRIERVWRDGTQPRDERYWDFLPISSSVYAVTTTAAEFGFGLERSGDTSIIVVSFLDDIFECQPVYVGFAVGHLIFGLMACTDGSGDLGIWDGCDNYDPYQSSCPGLPW